MSKIYKVKCQMLRIKKVKCQKSIRSNVKCQKLIRSNVKCQKSMRLILTERTFGVPPVIFLIKWNIWPLSIGTFMKRIFHPFQQEKPMFPDIWRGTSNNQWNFRNFMIGSFWMTKKENLFNQPCTLLEENKDIWTVIVSQSSFCHLRKISFEFSFHRNSISSDKDNIRPMDRHTR